MRCLYNCKMWRRYSPTAAKNAVLYFEKYSGKVLEEFTHKELPWLKAREGLAQNEPSTRIIDNNLIFEYYTSIKNKYNIVSLADIQSYIDKLW